MSNARVETSTNVTYWVYTIGRITGPCTLESAQQMAMNLETVRIVKKTQVVTTIEEDIPKDSNA